MRRKRVVFLKKAAKILFSVVMALAMAALAWYSLQDSRVAAAALAYEDAGFSYAGPLRGGLFDGHGEAVFADGARFSGTFRKGRADGNFIYDGADWRFVGGFDQGKPNGTLFLPGDGIATIDLRDRAHFRSPKGWEYSGGIGERGQNGEGSYIFPGGEGYMGGFLLGLAEGDGAYYDKDGNEIYVGRWKAGLYHGQGKYTSPDGKFLYEGAFEAGLPHGRAQYLEGETLRYDGDFVGGVPQGQGIYYSPLGWSYEGGFENGVFHGEGTLTRDGNPVTAQWEKGRRV